MPYIFTSTPITRIYLPRACPRTVLVNFNYYNSRIVFRGMVLVTYLVTSQAKI